MPERLKSLGPAAAATAATVVLGVAGYFAGVHGFGTYGYGIFVMLPLAQGVFAALFAGRKSRKSLGHCLSVAMTSVLMTGVLLLVFAFEGALCIVMAFPIVAAMAAVGACAGYYLQRRIPPSRGAQSLVMVLVLLSAPFTMGAETMFPREAPLYRVSTAVIIDAPPSAVWENVIRFPDIPPPSEPLFHTGIAYPLRATIVGAGVGAVRYCQFSTGNFVEPITTWQPGHLLAFNVARSPEPMHEWSPYGTIDTPHLHGYMTSRHGQFLLEALPGGRTRLTGTTWYQHHLWPAWYWRLWSDNVVHAIHTRVLEHIKHVAEDRHRSLCSRCE